jgi:hypothetical protein
MVHTPPTPPPTGPGSPQGPHAEAPRPAKKGGFHYKPMTFLGMHFNSDQATKLWQAVIQMLNSAIQKDKERAVKALRKLRGDAADQQDD